MSVPFATSLQTTYKMFGGGDAISIPAKGDWELVSIWWWYLIDTSYIPETFYQIIIIFVLTVYHCFLGTGGKCGFRPKLERHVYCHLSYTDGFRVYFSKRLVADTCWRARNHRQHNIIWRFSQPKVSGRKLQWNVDIG